MDFLELAQKRRSVRKYSDKKVTRESIERCLDAARLAPSACNSQPWTFIVIDDEKLKEEFVEKTLGGVHNFNKFVNEAPVVVAIVTESSTYTAKLGGYIKNIEYALCDVGMAAEHFALQAASDGLGTCFLGWFNEREAKRLLNVPKKKRVQLLISLGYPKEDKEVQKKRRAMSEMSSFNRYERT
jgi:nitroreductase